MKRYDIDVTFISRSGDSKISAPKSPEPQPRTRAMLRGCYGRQNFFSPMDTKVEKSKESRIKTVTTITDTERTAAEEKALRSLTSKVQIKGFRPGQAPPNLVKEKVGTESLLEETVRALLPSVLAEALQKSGAKPIIRPAVSVDSLTPLTIALTFVERPTVTLKKPDTLTVEKKVLSPVSDAEVSEFAKKMQEKEPMEESKKQVKSMLEKQKSAEEMRRREEEFYQKVRAATVTTLPSELIDTEVSDMVGDLNQRLREQNATFEDWLKRTGKKLEDVVKEMKDIARDRIILRLGMQELANHKKIEPDEKEFLSVLQVAREAALKDGHPFPPDEVAPGGSIYERIRWDMRMRRLVNEVVKD